MLQYVIYSLRVTLDRIRKFSFISVKSQMKPIESVVKSESSLLYRSGKLFRLKGGEGELVKGIEPSLTL